MKELYMMSLEDLKKESESGNRKAEEIAKFFKAMYALKQKQVINENDYDYDSNDVIL